MIRSSLLFHAADERKPSSRSISTGKYLAENLTKCAAIMNGGNVQGSTGVVFGSTARSRTDLLVEMLSAIGQHWSQPSQHNRSMDTDLQIIQCTTSFVCGEDHCKWGYYAVVTIISKRIILLAGPL